MTQGRAGNPPSWYLLLRASKYINVPPWELAKKPTIWRDWALVAESAERYAEAKHSRRLVK